MVYRLAGRLYGVRQALRLWNEKVKKMLPRYAIIHMEFCEGTYVHRNKTFGVIVPVYVDDLENLGAHNKGEIWPKVELNYLFMIMDLWMLQYRILKSNTQKDNWMFLSQSAYCRWILKKLAKESKKPALTLLFKIMDK